MRNFRNKWTQKIVSQAMLILFVYFTLNPTIGLALSGGPGQPELESFSPVGYDNLVDVFSGDLSYNLPILNVPGPDGGYPINLNYNAGPSMEQEASWVGLGWNLNPGVVNREVRGVPDDFSGQEVIKTLKQKPNRTFGAGIASKDVEILGADLQKVAGKSLKTSGNINLIYNNYKGFDVQAGVGFSLIGAEEAKAPQSASDGDILDKETGEITTKLSFGDFIKQNFSAELKKYSFSNIKHDLAAHFENLGKQANENPFSTFSSIMSQSVSDVGYTHPMTSSSYTFNAKLGPDALGTTKDLQVEVYYKEQKVKDQTIEVPAYGYFYSEENLQKANSGLMDFTLGNQSMITPDSRLLSVPNFTNDVFHVKAQGVSGSVRPYRGAVSLLTDPTVVSHTKNIGGGGEINSTGASNKVGVNLNGGDVKAYSGPWKAGYKTIDYLTEPLSAKKAAQPLLEPYYFKFSDDLTSQVNEGSMLSNQSAYSFNLGIGIGPGASEPKLLNSLNGTPIPSLTTSNSYRNEREPRSKSFFTLTENEAAKFDGGYIRQVESLSGSGMVNVPYDQSTPTGKKRLGAVHVTDQNGKNYVYGIPAKVQAQKDATFSVDDSYGTGLSGLISKTVAYGPGDNSTQNSNGQDEYYSSTETPEYAHSFLLTEILSEDYADIDDNGPSPSDFGSYVKFDYYVLNGFETKTPLVGANYIPGKLSNNGDDKATINYYKKDLYYLKSIQTKTHIALFELNTTPRLDAKGVAGENDNNASGQNQYSLSKVTLYNLKDYLRQGGNATPVKTVNFEYSNNLCGNAYPGGVGKLTLEKVWYSIGDEKTKMSLSPYVFHYDKNFSYNPSFVDKWSSYQPDSANTFGSNILYPYSTKNKSIADSYAGAWSLSRIDLPTGGAIEIDYESDDYRYVQNRKAQSMYKILGFASSTSSGYSQDLSASSRYMIVELPYTLTQPQVEVLVDEMDGIYFKAFMKMKKFGQGSLSPDNTPFSEGNTAYDFVEGYLNLESGPVLYGSPGESNMVALKVAKDGLYHPIKKAGWLELQTARGDLLDDSGISLSGFGNITAQLLGKIGGIITKALAFLAGQNKFFIKAFSKGWCNQLSSRGGLSSIVRLNSLDNKIGGGYRVKEITLSDSWGKMNGGQTTVYGQSYIYETSPGISSGVAQYEPMTGGEENPFRKPVRYSTGGVPIKNNYLYAELPIGEAFYPAASVGYSRVVIEPRANRESTIGGAGNRVSEFYTAKDYPIFTDYTEIKKINTDFVTKMVRYAGAKNFFQPGFSQGYYIEMNDMHGKKKSEATYASGTDIYTSGPVELTQYFYNTEGGYSPHKVNRLNNTVEVVYGEGVSRQNKMGVTQDSYIHLRENHERTICGDLDGQIEYTPPVVVIPTGFPNIDYSYTMTRTAVTNNVVFKSGILNKLVHAIDGAKTTTENLAFDHDTGEPVLTAVNDLHGNRIYNYNQLAKWYYNEMGGKYQNQGIEIVGSVNNYSQFLVPGDLLMNPAGDKAWVTSNTGTAITCHNSAGTTVSNLSGYRVITSGYGNNLGAVMSSIQTTEDPLGINGLGFNLPLFESYNKMKDTIAELDSIPVLDCKTGGIYNESFHHRSATTSGYSNCVQQIDTVYETSDRGFTPVGTTGTYIHKTATDSTTTTSTILEAEYLSSEFLGGYEIKTYGYTTLVDKTICHYSGKDFEWYIQFADFSCTGNDGIVVEVHDVDTAYNIEDFDIIYAGGNKVYIQHPNGYRKAGDVLGSSSGTLSVDIAECYVRCLQGVLNASATNFSDATKKGRDLPSTLVTGPAFTNNPYRYNFKGVYKPRQSLFYPERRSQSGKTSTEAMPFDFLTEIDSDGEFHKFYWYDPTSSDPTQWEIAREVTGYDQNGQEIEEQNALGNYSAVLYGHERTLPMAVANNCRYDELAYDGFEEYGGAYNVYKLDNHLNLGGTATLDSSISHSGRYSVDINSITPVSIDLADQLNLQAGKKYLVQVWHTASTGGAVSVNNGSVDINAEILTVNIEGWELLEVVFEAGASNYLKLSSGDNGLFDDLKIQPFNSSVKSFVYDRLTHKLSAQLDENHFATFYNYNKDQVLTQVKKETERGIKTIQSTQKVTQQINP